MAFDSAPVGMAITTDTGAFVQINAAFCDLLGVAHSALLGRRLEDFAAPDAAAALSDGWRLAAGGWRPADRPRHTTDTELRPAIGHLLPVTLTCARVPTSADGGAYLVIHVQDGSERRAAEAELTRRTLHDPLTGLPNRVLLLDRLTRALARLERHPSTLAVLFADLNGFKAINGTHGHSTGDQVLVAVAHRLQQLQRPGDTACRYGADEFVVLSEGSGRGQATNIAKRVHTALTVPIRWVNPRPDQHGPDQAVSATLTASIGIATTNDPSVTAHQLLNDAEIAMYRTKR